MCWKTKVNNSEFKPKPLEDVLDALYMKLEVESICRMSSSDTLKLLASVIWYLEDLKEIKDVLKKLNRCDEWKNRKLDLQN